jgi:hypothetical protein
MKEIIRMVLLVVIIAATSCNDKKTVEIKDTRQLKDSIPDLSSQGKSDGDIVLYRPFDNVYGIIVYRTKEGKLLSKGILFPDSYDYNTAKYRWVNDTTLSFQLFGKVNESDWYTLILGYDGKLNLQKN